ncbi:hypothetical protein NC652_029093 [Populus alba x Populus x berolinensis]|nr:hypothetical protein NC652_029093 [Populus alba x Populus x berolinensis]
MAGVAGGGVASAAVPAESIVFRRHMRVVNNDIYVGMRKMETLLPFLPANLMKRSELPLIWKNDGMPPDYARIHSLIPVKPFEKDIVSVIAEARAAQMMETGGKPEEQAKVADPADIPSVFRRMITKASKEQVEEREAKGEMALSSSPIQGDLRWEMPQKLGKVKNRPEILFSYTLGGHISSQVS